MKSVIDYPCDFVEKTSEDAFHCSAGLREKFKQYVGGLLKYSKATGANTHKGSSYKQFRG